MTLLVLASLAAAATLEIDGMCGETVAIDVSGLTPDGAWAILTASDLGAAVVPGGPCDGLVLGLGDDFSLRRKGRADGAGEVHLSPTLPAPGTCEQAVQVVDATTCAASNVLRIPSAPRSCADILARDPLATTGAYTLWSPSRGSAFEAWCWMDGPAGGGWTRVARFDGATDYYCDAPSEPFDLFVDPDRAAARLDDVVVNEIVGDAAQILYLHRDVATEGVYTDLPGGVFDLSVEDHIGTWTCVDGSTVTFSGNEMIDYGCGPIARGDSGNTPKIAVNTPFHPGGLHIRAGTCGIDTGIGNGAPGSVYVR